MIITKFNVHGSSTKTLKWIPRGLFVLFQRWRAAVIYTSLEAMGNSEKSQSQGHCIGAVGSAGQIAVFLEKSRTGGKCMCTEWRIYIYMCVWVC